VTPDPKVLNFIGLFCGFVGGVLLAWGSSITIRYLSVFDGMPQRTRYKCRVLTFLGIAGLACGLLLQGWAQLIGPS